MAQMISASTTPRVTPMMSPRSMWPFDALPGESVEAGIAVIMAVTVETEPSVPVVTDSCVSVVDGDTVIEDNGGVVFASVALVSKIAYVILGASPLTVR